MGIQAAYPAGRFDQALMAADCNGKMFELMGNFVYSSLYKIVIEEDIARIEKMLERCRQNPEIPMEECIHIVTEKENYDTYIMNVTYEDEGQKYYIEMYNLASTQKLLEKAERDKHFLRDFLSLMGGIYFAYEPSDDAFSMFWLDYEQKVELYSMTFSQWETEMLKKHWVNEKDAAVFRAFCRSVRNSTGEQTYTFHGSILSKGQAEEAYRVRFVSRSYGDEAVTEGTWLSINEQTGSVEDDYISSVNMDSLTKTLNRNAIMKYAQTSLENGEEPAVIMLDVDNFKSINDTYGHPFGDQVIVAAADVLKKVVGGNGMVGRIGGDEFMIILKDYSDELGLRNYLRGIRMNVATLFQDKVGDNKISCSIGVARCGVEATGFRELYRIADKALYIAKQKGKNRYIIYKPEMHGRFNTKSDDLDMKEIRGSFYPEEELNKFSLCMEEFVLCGMEKLPGLLEQVVRTLAVNRAEVYWGENRQRIAAYPVENGRQNGLVFETQEYKKQFVDDMLAISNINMLEFGMSEQYAACCEIGTQSLMQHVLRNADGEPFGLVSLEERNTMRAFPKLAVQLFKNMCRVLNAMLLREGV